MDDLTQLNLATNAVLQNGVMMDCGKFFAEFYRRLTPDLEDSIRQRYQPAKDLLPELNLLLLPPSENDKTRAGFVVTRRPFLEHGRHCCRDPRGATQEDFAGVRVLQKAVRANFAGKKSGAEGLVSAAAKAAPLSSLHHANQVLDPARCPAERCRHLGRLAGRTHSSLAGKSICNLARASCFNHASVAIDFWCHNRYALPELPQRHSPLAQPPPFETLDVS
jgi:hypothetical protein